MVRTYIARRLAFKLVVLSVAAFLICSVWPASARAVERAPTTNSKSLAEAGKKATPKTATPKVDNETEAKSLDLVQSHLPELRDVLKRLRADQPRQYDRAICDLAKSARKLEVARNRDERLYDIEVELLKAQNQVTLLAAKLKVRDSEADRKLLRNSAARLQQAQIARVDYDVEMYRQRLERTKKQLDAAQARLESKKSDTDEQLEKSYLGLLRKAGREPKNKKD